MPTPIEILMDPISLALLSMFSGLMVWEAVAPARKLPVIKNWKLMGLGSFAIYFYLSSYLPLLWDGALVSFQIVDISHLSTFLQVVIGLCVFELTLYFWHRAMHEVDLLWKVFHQMHHSAERLDTYGAFWFSPTDMVGFTFIGSIALVVITGIDAQAATAVMMITFFLGVFQHLNVKTPLWLGYLVQRPESHSVHHGKDVHRNNYADIPLLDMMFNTYSNPEEFSDTGFHPGASYRVPEMLLFKDVYLAKDLTETTTGDEMGLEAS